MKILGGIITRSTSDKVSLLPDTTTTGSPNNLFVMPPDPCGALRTRSCCVDSPGGRSHDGHGPEQHLTVGSSGTGVSRIKHGW